MSEAEQALWSRVYADELQRLIAGMAAGLLRVRSGCGEWEACAGNAAQAADESVKLLRERASLAPEPRHAGPGRGAH